MEMFRIEVAGGEPASVCSECLADETWFDGTHVRCCPSVVAGLCCSNSTHADAVTGALRRAIVRRRELGAKGPTLYKMVVVPDQLIN